jgi:hypothetical protein
MLDEKEKRKIEKQFEHFNLGSFPWVALFAADGGAC